MLNLTIKQQPSNKSNPIVKQTPTQTYKVHLQKEGIVSNEFLDTIPLKFVRTCKMQGVEGEGAGSLLT